MKKAISASVPSPTSTRSRMLGSETVGGFCGMNQEIAAKLATPIMSAKTIAAIARIGCCGGSIVVPDVCGMCINCSTKRVPATRSRLVVAEKAPGPMYSLVKDAGAAPRANSSEAWPR